MSIANPVHSLTFGDLVWVEEGSNPPDSSGVTYRVRAQDATFGTAVPVTVALLWLGRAGGPVTYDSTPNREPVFRITVEAQDSDLLARGEMALQLACEQATLLTWTPPDGAGEPSVFEIMWSHLEPIFDRDGLTGVGMEETVLRSRTYLVRMQAIPYARSKDLVVTPAETATETSIDNGSSAASWTLDIGTSLVSSAGALVLTSTTPPSSGFLSGVAAGTMHRTGAVDLSAARLLKVNWTTSAALAGGISVQLDGGTALPESLRTTSGGFTVSYFSLPPSTGTIATITISVQWHSQTTTQTLSVDAIASATGLPFIGTARQKAMSLVPGGSVKPSGSIQVAHPSSALGKTIVYTHPSGTGYLPPLRPRLTQSQTVNTDATTLSGARHLIGPTTFTRYSVPVTALPKGRVELWARVRATASIAVPGIIRWAVGSKMGASDLSYELFSTTYTFAVLNTWYLIPLGSATMPPVDMGPAGFVAVDLHEIDTSLGIEVDEAYLFATDHGSLTIVDCGTAAPSAGGSSNRLWIDAPTPDVPMGAIYRGFTADRSDAFHAGPDASVWGTHDFDPRGTSVFVATSGATDAATSLEHYRRYNTFVSRED